MVRFSSNRTIVDRYTADVPYSNNYEHVFYCKNCLITMLLVVADINIWMCRCSIQQCLWPYALLQKLSHRCAFVSYWYQILDVLRFRIAMTEHMFYCKNCRIVSCWYQYWMCRCSIAKIVSSLCFCWLLISVLNVHIFSS